MVAELSESQLEKRVAWDVRRIIQKVRACTPENYDARQEEVMEALASNEDGLGSLKDEVQEECTRGLEVAQHRVELILEERRKEELRWSRPLGLIKEMDDLQTEFQEKHSQYKESLPTEDSPMTIEQVPGLQGLTESFEEQHKEFTDQLKEFSKTKAPEMLSPSLPGEIKRSWMAIVKKLSATSQEAEVDIALTKKEMKRLQEVAKKELVASQVQLYKEKLQESPGHEAFLQAEKVVVEAEKKVEPFVRPKGRSEAEMKALAAEVKSAAEEAKASVEKARGQIHLEVEEADLEESVKAEIKAFVKKETKYYAIRFGQFGQRIQRCHNLLGLYQLDMRKGEMLKKIAELKPAVLEKVKQLDGTARIDEINTAMKEAEQEVDLSKKSATMSVAEMDALSVKIAEKVESVKAIVEGFRQKMCPVEMDVDEDVKKALRAILASEMKTVEQKLVFQEKRLTLLERLAANFKDQIEKKKASRLQLTRAAALRITKLAREAGREDQESLTTEELFDLFDKNKDGVVDKTEFLEFFTEVDSKSLKKPSQEELEMLFDSRGEESLDWPAFRSLFASFMKVQKVTSLTDELRVQPGQAIRELSVGEELEVLDGPKPETSINVKRVKVSAEDGAIGWATIASNAGTIFLTNVTR